MRDRYDVVQTTSQKRITISYQQDTGIYHITFLPALAGRTSDAAEGTGRSVLPCYASLTMTVSARRF